MEKHIVRIMFIVVIAHVIASCSSSSEVNESSFRLADLNGLWIDQEIVESGRVIDTYIQIEVIDTENRLFVFNLSDDDQNCFYRTQVNLTAVDDNSFSFLSGGSAHVIMFAYSNDMMVQQFVDTLDIDDDEDVDEIQTVRYVRSQGLLAEDIPECF